MLKNNQTSINMYKKWLVIISTTIASGLLLLNSPSIVHAENLSNNDSFTTEVQPSETPLPDGISAEDILISGEDGTSPYFVTKDGVLYFMGGAITYEDTAKIPDLVKQANGKVISIDTSKATSDVVFPEDSSSLFGGPIMTESPWVDLESINFDQHVDTSKVTNMNRMFYFDNQITNLNLNSFDVTNVTNFSYTFAEMNRLQTLTIDSWKPTKITDFDYFIYGDDELQSIDFSNFDLTGVIFDEYSSFFGSTNLKSVTFGSKNFFNKGNLPTNNISKEWISTDEKYKFYSKDFDIQPILKDFYSEHAETEKITFVPVEAKGSVTMVDTSIVNGKEFDSTSTKITTAEKRIDGNPTINVAEFPTNGTLDPNQSTISYQSIVSPESNYQYTFNDFMSLFQQLGKKITLNDLNNFKYLYDNFYEALIATNGSDSWNGSTLTMIRVYTAPEEPVTPTKPSHSHSHSNSNSNQISTPTIISNSQYIATFKDQPDVSLWSFDSSKNTMNLISDRALGPNSYWYSDQQITINNTDYFRVGANEWVKSNEVYPYWTDIQTIVTHNDSYKMLYTAKGKLVKNRALAQNSAWHTDYYIKINGDKCYRVAINEFVKASDVDLDH